MNKKSISTLLGLAVLTVSLILLRQRSNTANPQNSSTAQPNAFFEIGKSAPYFATLDFDGNQVKLSDFAGKAMVLDFWAAWCPFCVEELPELEAVHQQTKDEVVFLGIHRTDSGESIEKGLEFAKKQGVTYLLLQNPTGEIYKMATKGINAMPTAVFIDKDGIVRDIKLGPKTEKEIREKVEALLENF